MYGEANPHITYVVSGKKATSQQEKMWNSITHGKYDIVEN